jgi:hypothetical protein
VKNRHERRAAKAGGVEIFAGNIEILDNRALAHRGIVVPSGALCFLCDHRVADIGVWVMLRPPDAPPVVAGVCDSCLARFCGEEQVIPALMRDLVAALRRSAWPDACLIDLAHFHAKGGRA